MATAYRDGVAGLPLLPPPDAPAGETHSWHLYVARLGDAAPIGRDTLIERLFADGIGCSVHYIPLHLQPYWRERYRLTPEQFPHSQRAFETNAQPADLSAHGHCRRRSRAALVARGARLSGDEQRGDGRQAHVRRRRRRLRPRGVGAPPARAGGLDTARFARPGAVSPGTRRPQRQDISHPQVPDHARQPRAAAGPAITVGADPRITRAGAFLRRHKLDELPQLIDVLRGDMSLVGPRPELPSYVAGYPPALRDKVLSVRPGITDVASIEFRNEAELLARAADPDREYREVVLPAKLRLAAAYVDSATLASDLRVIGRTLKALCWTR